MFKKPLYFYKAAYLEAGRPTTQLSGAAQWQEPAVRPFSATSTTQQATATATATAPAGGLSGLQHLLPAHLLPEVGRAGERGGWEWEETGVWLPSGQKERLFWGRGAPVRKREGQGKPV